MIDVRGENMNILSMLDLTFTNYFFKSIKSFMYFNISVVCQFLRLPLVLERSNFGFRVVLKSPPLIIFVVSFNNSNKL